MSDLSETQAPLGHTVPQELAAPEPVQDEAPDPAPPANREPLPPEVEEIVRRLREGQTFVSLRVDDPDGRAQILALTLAQIAGDGVKLVWTGNPLRSPFTIDRLMLQAAGPEADLRVDHGPAELAALLAETAGDQRRCIIIVQQPETIDKVTRETLSRMAPHLAAAPRPVQLFFCGSTAFNPLDTLSRPPVPLLALRAPTRADGLVPSAAPGRNAGSLALPLAALLCLACFLLYALHVAREPGPETLPPKILTLLPSADAAPTQPPPAPTQPTPSPTEPTPAPAQAPETAVAPAPAAIDLQALRREFDQFLESQPDQTAGLSASQRDELFREYLRRAQLTPARTPL